MYNYYIYCDIQHLHYVRFILTNGGVDNLPKCGAILIPEVSEEVFTNIYQELLAKGYPLTRVIRKKLSVEEEIPLDN